MSEVSQNSTVDVRARFAQRLRASRRRKGYKTARSFADVLNIDENRYSRWERAEVAPDFFMLGRICAELAVTPNDLLLRAVHSEQQPQEPESVELIAWGSDQGHVR